MIDQQHAKRLAIYREAVQHGFYNEAAGTVVFRGFHIMHDETNYVVVGQGVRLMQFLDPFVAKCWITARLDHCTIREAAQRVRSMERAG